jgi:hypothetical protein
MSAQLPKLAHSPPAPPHWPYAGRVLVPVMLPGTVVLLQNDWGHFASSSTGMLMFMNLKMPKGSLLDRLAIPQTDSPAQHSHVREARHKGLVEGAAICRLCLVQEGLFCQSTQESSAPQSPAQPGSKHPVIESMAPLPLTQSTSTHP